MNEKDTKVLQQARESLRDAARPDIVSRVHGTKKLTAASAWNCCRRRLAVEYVSIAGGGTEARESGSWRIDFVAPSAPTGIASSTDSTDHAVLGAGMGRLF